MHHAGYFTIQAAWDVPANGDYCRVAYHDTCVFGVRVHSLGGALLIGTQDISDLIGESQARGTSDDYVQFEGTMSCHTSGGASSQSIDWAIFRS